MIQAPTEGQRSGDARHQHCRSERRKNIRPKASDEQLCRRAEFEESRRAESTEKMLNNESRVIGESVRRP